mmetsp:Transcript_27867/g.46836  ORF Transcript_27867/g.46836 Transcript_27867/m.46836 type:complete len:789 (-) Transcript_27867:312-2678(-)|eukprot:CAMPEP_0174979596 /NCGR_PEP_ID=MMETSP0004_2-20121128/14875_1 /TAXON_ID=420556 /ORGANISM="Ochromonas sp., Strain CCMP1393" /LENGTH=788 /DNA_ID=CAMNT_0016231153 /DNA_START=143 /DNA_END=2509 /DNA_ORIENTATION=-
MGDNTQNIIQLDVGWNQEIKKIALDPLESMLNDGFKKSSKLFSNQEYAKVYTTCYNMCTQKSPYNWSEQLYQRHGETISNYLSTSVLPALQGRHAESLLTEFVKRAENHNIMNRWHQKFFMYLDRYHVKYHQLPSLQDAGLKYFKTIVFDDVKKQVTDALVSLVNGERNGAMTDRELVRKCILVYETMGMGSLDAYVADFETQLLDATRDFYAHKAESWVAEDSTPTYMIRVEQALEEEKDRVAAYLNSDTEAKLLLVLDTELLQKRETELLEKDGSGCRVLLANDMVEDLARMFRLFSRIPDGLVPVAETFKQHITDMGAEKIEQRLSRVENRDEKEKDTNDDPQFIRDLLAVHEKYLKMVSEQFQGSTLFQKALKDAFNDLVNRDVGRFKTADLISSFCDRLLKTGSSEKLSDIEVEEYLEKTVQLFSYLTDQDLFAEIYRNQLARRLLNQRSASDDMERLMIGKLKLKCGAQFTSKMEGMLNDLSIGAEHSQNFEKYCKENQEHTGLGKLEFTVQVLTTGHWPHYNQLSPTLPAILQRCTQVYKEHYDAKTSHRRLAWTFSHGQAVVKGTFGKKSFDLQVTTLQAIVMLAFNKDPVCPGGAAGDPISFSTLQQSLALPEDVLKRVIHSLACGKYKILKRVAAASSSGSSSSSSGSAAAGGEEGGEGKSEKPAEKQKGVLVTDVYAFNEAFTCPMRKIRIPMSLLEESHNPKRVEEDRTVAIEAAIVRIMKARLTLAHSQLVAEVLSQLSFFRPDPKLIKRRIEALIDREYLERDKDNTNHYKYMA